MEILRSLLTLPVIGIAALVIVIILFIALGYVKAPPDTAIIISGLGKKPRIYVGKAGIRSPFLERMDKLLLKQISIDIKTDDYIPTQDFINIKVDAVAKVHVDMSKIDLAMTNFLNKTEEEIIADLQDTLQGNMREIIGTMSLKEICNDRNTFGNKVKESATPDMSSLGIEILSCNIQSISDRNNLIEDMGMDNTSKIKKEAAIAKAQSEKDIAVAEAEALKASNDARVKSETEIAERNNELAIKQAELKISSDAKKAEADAAYKIQEQEQRRTIEVSSMKADIAKQQQEKELKRIEAEVAEQALDAEIKKKADADQYAEEKKAEVELFQRQKDADAKAYETSKDADARAYEIIKEAEALKVKAEAEKYAAEQKAEGIRTIGEAEAAAIKAKGIAEAEGIDKKAEAMKKMGEASVLEMFFNAYPQIMAAAAKPLENVDKITMYGEGNSAKLVQDIVNSSSQVVEAVKESTGIDLPSLNAGFLGGKVVDSNENEKNQ